MACFYKKHFFLLSLSTLKKKFNMKNLFLFVVLAFVTTLSFGQTTIFNVTGGTDGGGLPSTWTATENGGLFIEQTNYFLLQSGATSDIIITDTYDLSTYTSVTFTLDVAAYGGGSDNPAKIEISFDGGSTWAQTEISFTPTSASYIAGGSFNLSTTTNQVQIRISNNGTSGKGVRLQNLKLQVNDIVPPTNLLVITGVFSGPVSGYPKGIELYVIDDIPDLSIFGLGKADNGGGSDGQEYTFPSGGASKGDYIYVTSNFSAFSAFFGFSADYGTSILDVNGDDAVELFERGLVIDVFGDINVDGTGTAWDYENGWAYRNAVGPSTSFVAGDWRYNNSGEFGGATNELSLDPFPLDDYNSTVLSVVKNQIDNFTMYPNPVSNGRLYMSSSNNLNKQVKIYALTGQQVYSNNIQTEDYLNISNLNRGIYLVRIEEDGKIATRKLVVN
jgi:hypothetical protein